MKALFYLGNLVATQGVAFDQNEHAALKVLVHKSIQRHVSGDWGDLCQEDKDLNDLSLKPGEDRGRLFSSYNLPEDLKAVTGEEKIWIITEWDRSATTVLYPSEY